MFLHGWPLDHRVMVGDFEPLFEGRKGWRRVYPDLPGMGRTRGAARITNQDQVLDILLQFIDNVIAGQFLMAWGAVKGERWRGAGIIGR